MALFKKTASKDASEWKALQAELERSKTELESTNKALAEALKNIEVKIPTPPKAKTIKVGHEYVDLGLPNGVKWATCNVGANKPEEYGDYYAWGETKTKKEYTSENCKTFAKDMKEISSSIRNDVACANWGGGWRIPNKAEFVELATMCTCMCTEQNGISGCVVIGLNGNRIFLPAAGSNWPAHGLQSGKSCVYWSSSPDKEDNQRAYRFHFSSKEPNLTYRSEWRNPGFSVRPVIK